MLLSPTPKHGSHNSFVDLHNNHSSGNFIDLDVSTLASVPSPSISPAPPNGSITSPYSKTHAFFSSSFSPKGPMPPSSPHRNDTLPSTKTSKPLRSLTADFFGTKSPPSPKAPTPTTTTSRFQSFIRPAPEPSRPIEPASQLTDPVDPVPPKKRNYLNLDLHDAFNDSGLSEMFASTPTPSVREGWRSGSFTDTPDEPTPRPPAMILNLSHPPPKPPSLFSSTKARLPSESIPSELQSDPPPGTEEDAEVIFSDYASSSVSSDSHDSDAVEELTSGVIIRSMTSGFRDQNNNNGLSTSPTSLSSPLSSTLSPPPSNLRHIPSISPIPVTLRLTQPLGQGTFSSVWLAQDLSPTPLLLKARRSIRDLRRKEGLDKEKGDFGDEGRLKTSSRMSASSLMKRLRGGVTGTRPGGGSGTPVTTGSTTPLTAGPETPETAGPETAGRRFASSGSVYLDERDGSNLEVLSLSRAPSIRDGESAISSLSRASSLSWQSVSSDGESVGSGSLRRTRSAPKRLVAVKLTLRGVIENRSHAGSAEEERERDRTRVSFVREVEILKHISHPNITSLLSHLTTRTHHILVLPYLPGGDLLALVNSNGWDTLGETTLTRIFSELCKAVGWMHDVGLVHRDVKLENIVLTVPLYTPPGITISPTQSCFPEPLIPAPPQPLIKLTDFGLSRFIDPGKPLLSTRCGSEAYAAPELVIGTGRRGVASSDILWGAGKASGSSGGYDARETDAWACGVVLYGLVARRLPFGEGPGEAVGPGIVGETVQRTVTPSERRAWLMKIAQGEWKWPEVSDQHQDDSELRGPALVQSAGARRMVERLLVRDPSKRARISELWDDPWIHGDYTKEAPVESELVQDLLQYLPPEPEPEAIDGLPDEEEDEDDDEEEELHQGGMLVDKDSIDNVARQELQ
ncbi:kinase-like domain-containing protein [Mycena floridula]|nr:kinase-like domain-containing protein [Mycena floridula]